MAGDRGVGQVVDADAFLDHRQQPVP